MNVVENLARLRDADAGRGAPEQVEAVVMAAFRARRRRPKTMWWVAAGAMAAAFAGALLLWPVRVQEMEPVPVRMVRMPEPPAVVVRPVVVRHRRPRRAAKPPLVAAEFIPVPYAPPLPSGEIQIVRVRLASVAAPTIAMQADVVTGADGIVRAVRWVR